jgi:hypothetical protein
MSSATIDPVCEDAARAPCAVRPDLTVIPGFLRVTRRAISVKRRGFPNDSRYSRISCVRGSSSHHSRRSLPETSALLPTLTKLDMPRSSSRAVSRIATPSAPLCEAIATRPG